MTAQIQPISSVNQRATSALLKEIGAVDTIRFLNQFRTGTGDYTAERRQLFHDLTVNEIVKEIQAQRRSR